MLLFLAGAGCFHKNTVSPPEGPNASNKENLEGIVKIVPVELHKTQEATNGGSCAVDLVYPTLPSSPFIDASAAFESEVYTFIQHQLESEEAPTSPEDVERAADEYLANCLALLEAGSAAEAEGVADYLDQYAAVDFNISLNVLHMLSVNLTAEGYNGGAHGYSTESFINVDLGGNKLVRLGDILVDSKLKEFFQQEKERLLNEQTDVLYPSSAEEFNTFINDDSEMEVEEQYNVYGQFENFYLTPDKLVTFYDSYEIAPYAAGPIRVELPLTEIADFIDPSEPFYPVLEAAQQK